MRHKIILLALFILFGIFLLRGGIIGLVISESCCFGPECASENMCPVEPSLERPAMLSSEDNNALSVVGLLITVISVLMVFWYLKKRVKIEKEE